MKTMNQACYKLDWGAITIEGFSDEKKEALHVFNSDLSKKEKIDRVKKFAIGRVIWAHKHFPTGTNQRIVFDVRGQSLSSQELEEIKNSILESVIVIISTKLSIEFKL